MTLWELSYQYQQSAEMLSARMRELRAAAKEADNPELKNRLDRRMAELRPLLQEARELTLVTRHYYDRRYSKNGKYTL